MSAPAPSGSRAFYEAHGLQVRRELQAAGFKHLKTVQTLPLQHLIVFQLAASDP